MQGLHRTTYDNFHLGTQLTLTADQAQQLIALLKTPTLPAGSTLGGRTSVITGQITGIGKLVIKHYRRGGFISHFNKKTYLGFGKPRCQIEFEMLNHVRDIGVSAPEPIAFAHRGRLLYQCWLATRMIPSHQTLVQLSRVDLARSLVVIDSVADQIERLVENGIRHIDLHPGNVIIDPENKIYFIDFDKARLTRMSLASLRKHYLERWKRAVVKHRLAPDLWKKLEAAMGGPK
jgi:tRNA A-37 threonylcarbamoyl transferase component Bud32